MANVTHKVVSGDTLSELAVTYGTTVNALVSLNHIKNPDLIYVGQVLIISGTATTKKPNTSSTATIDAFGLQSNGTYRTVFATWDWDKDYTDSYSVLWRYATGDGVWFIGHEGTVTHKQSVYTAPDYATKITFKVKPISKKKTVNNKETSYWTAQWSTQKTYNFSDNPPETPDVPQVEIKGLKLTAELSNLDLNATNIEFQVVKDDKTTFKTGRATITTTSASFSCNVTAGSKYKVRARAFRGTILYSDWSAYSNNIETVPAAPKSISELKALSETSVRIEWNSVSTATNYEIQYTTDKNLFDSSSDVDTLTIESVVNHAIIDGLKSGEEYFMRVRSINEKGQSGWTGIKSIKIGKPPIAPTTWSSTTTAITGDPLTLYWVHNTEDGSSQTKAELQMYINGVGKTITITNTNNEDEKDKTSSYSIDTSAYPEGTKIEWRVRTRGILETYGEWSIQRTIDVYSPPTLELTVTDAYGEIVNELASYPLYISGIPGPNTQTIIGYHISVKAMESYETIDGVGRSKIIQVGEEIYSKYFDVSQPLLIELSANNLTLENNIEYQIVCTVSMNSGLTAEATSNFTVAWAEEENVPDAEIGYDADTCSTFIRPYCWTGFGELTTDVLLSVYRREFDGSLTELVVDLDAAKGTFITDPHPSLDYARYRIISKSKETGVINYYDAPPYPIGEVAAILQWNEEWTSFEASGDDVLEKPSWSGSLLRLPYNVDVSDQHGVDVELVEYIGRDHPVSYYGTQKGTRSTWNMEIEKSDVQTLYALRRLAIWTGDVYVREPSGSGYWANVTVSFSQKHLEMTIPITLQITRVSGGA